MCGICGIITNNSAKIKEILVLMNRAIIHRGPDDEGYFEHNNAGLAMCRLSIIDLHTGHQPMFTPDNRMAIVFNGEIYNFNALKSRHLSDYKFRTKSDTEVVLYMYHKFGRDCLEYLRGIFAFAIYDLKLDQIFIARDRIGVKPLFYYSDNHSFLFSSDILSFHSIPSIDLSIKNECLGDYLRYGYIPQPGTIFKHIKALRPGHFAVIDSDAIILVQRYYDLSTKIDHLPAQDFNLASITLKNKVHESVSEQLVSDVPVGSFLSGGIDSSIITTEMVSELTEPINTFTIGFKGGSNNQDIILSSVLSEKLLTNHHEKIVEPNMDEVLKKIINALGQPFAITSSIPVYINSCAAREKVKVVLSGDGADEIFGGYNRYHQFFRYKNLHWLKFLHGSFIKSILKDIAVLLNSTKFNKAYQIRFEPFLSFLSQPDDLHRYINIIGAGSDDLVAELLNNDNRDVLSNTAYSTEFQIITEKRDLNYNSLMLFDVHTSLVDEMLTKVDFASMLSSLEVRVPFLDHRLVEFGLSIPGEFKIDTLTNKKILKEAYRNSLPAKILNAPKRGFNLPLDNWIKRHWARSFLSAFNSDLMNELGLNKQAVNKRFSEYLKGHPAKGVTFFYIYILICWYENLLSRRGNNEV